MRNRRMNSWVSMQVGNLDRLGLREGLNHVRIVKADSPLGQRVTGMSLPMRSTRSLCAPVSARG